MSDSKEIVATEDGDHGQLVPSNSDNLLFNIIEASKDPAVDAGKMRAMAELAIQLQDRENQRRFNIDLANAISEMPIITKAGKIVIVDKVTGQTIQTTFYEKFEDLDRVVKPIARRNNITYNFDVGGDKDRLLVTVILRHTTTGIVERSSPMPLMLETSGSKNNVQGAGSTNSYGKRYALKNVFAISVEGADDDGNQGALSMPQERRNIVIDEAQAAFDAGRYNEWFHSQSAKDRALLIGTGKHSEFGGVKALPGTIPVEPDHKANGPNVATPEGWTEQYEMDCAEVKTLDDLAALQQRGSGAIDKLKKNKHDDLHQRAIKAGSDAYARISAELNNKDD